MWTYLARMYVPSIFAVATHFLCAAKRWVPRIVQNHSTVRKEVAAEFRKDHLGQNHKKNFHLRPPAENQSCNVFFDWGGVGSFRIKLKQEDKVFSPDCGHVHALPSWSKLREAHTNIRLLFAVDHGQIRSRNLMSTQKRNWQQTCTTSHNVQAKLVAIRETVKHGNWAHPVFAFGLSTSAWRLIRHPVL